MNPKGPASMEIIITISLVLTVLALATGAFNFYKNHNNVLEIKNKEKLASEEKAEKEKQLLSYPNQVNLNDWKIYKNKKYGFEIKYPKDWTAPQEQSFSNTESKIYFEKPVTIGKNQNNINLNDYGNLNYGLKIKYPSNLIKPKNKTSDLETETRGFYILVRAIPKLAKSQVIDSSVFPHPSRNSSYEEIYSLPIGTNLCYSREIQILKDNFYFKRTYFYTLANDKYTFNLVPFQKKNDTYYFYNNKNETEKMLPEFYSSLSTFVFRKEVIIPVTRPAVHRAPVSTGKISCHEKNDHSSKSDTKGKHIDEDCCPDPDEWPKPGCIYSPGGYALMLSGPGKKK